MAINLKGFWVQIRSLGNPDLDPALIRIQDPEPTEFKKKKIFNDTNI